ncbi:hypothetical protein Leryth_004332 [Lithospermum erythrorhizon]|nr:hypothetical protein Leryth_004332 [Lithospermum erythrorhizon]
MGLVKDDDKACSSARYSMNRTISEFLGQVLMMDDVSERLRKFDEYINKLEDEMRKIVAFQNELPLSMLILNDAIVAVKEEAMQCRKLNTGPVLEQFIPLKRNSEKEDDKKVEIFKESENSKEKMNWMSSVQLWNGNSSNNKQGKGSDIRKRVDDELRAVKSCENKSMGIASGSFKGYNGFPFEIVRKEEKHDLPLVPELSLRIPGIKSPRDDTLISGLSFKASVSSITGSSSTSNGQSNVPSKSQQQSNRKQRRCWSTELHRKFVESLEQLGGSQVATPKQIRELMQVDGVTNDEVKSHLQKYRLHIRRAPNTKASDQSHSLALGGLGSPQDKFGETPKQSNSQSGSPHGPLHFVSNSRGTSMAAGNSMEDEDDEKSESDCWKSDHVHSSENDSV